MTRTLYGRESRVNGSVLRYCGPMDRTEFDRIVNETILTLPPQFQQALENVAIVIEDVQTHANSGGMRGVLLGLYQGTPITTWGRDYSGKLPDKISLFKDNIEWAAGSPDRVPETIRTTLLHEIAHYFGYDHDKIHRMERRWRQSINKQ
jgi:predicted Zn-dependent protease with MMP-like domain